jgi:hypothetical protein
MISREELPQDIYDLRHHQSQIFARSMGKETHYIPVKAEEKVKVFPKICYKYMHCSEN